MFYNEEKEVFCINYVGNYIKKYRGKTSLRTFAEKCGISHTHLDSIEKGIDPRTGKPVSVTVETLKKIAKAMNMTINDLLIESGEVKIEDLTFDNADHIDLKLNTVKIPIFGTIKAGVPLESQTDIIEYMDIPKDWTKGGKTLFGLQLSGDSMYPKYQDKEIVIFEQTNDLETYKNKDCAVMVNHTESTFKKVLINDKGMVLQPYNSSYDIMMFSNEEIKNLPITILGVARKKVSDID